MPKREHPLAKTMVEMLRDQALIDDLAVQPATVIADHCLRAGDVPPVLPTGSPAVGARFMTALFTTLDKVHGDRYLPVNQELIDKFFQGAAMAEQAWKEFPTVPGRSNTDLVLRAIRYRLDDVPEFGLKDIIIDRIGGEGRDVGWVITTEGRRLHKGSTVFEVPPDETAQIAEKTEYTFFTVFGAPRPAFAYFNRWKINKRIELNEKGSTSVISGIQISQGATT